MKPSLFLAALAISAASMAVAVPAGAAEATVKLSNGTLVAANGLTLYTFDADQADSGKSTCNGPCAAPGGRRKRPALRALQRTLKRSDP